MKGMFAKKALAKKINKKMGSDKFSVININRFPRAWKPGTYVICSIDPGEVNFAMRVERRIYKLTEPGGPKLLSRMVLLYEFTDVIGDEMESSYSYLTTFLDSKLSVLKTCNIFLIEKQLPINYPKVRINQHIVSYLLLRLHDSPINPVIYELHPTLKSQMFKMMHMTEAQLKKRSVEIAEDILRFYGDLTSIAKIEGNRNVRGKKKKDDLGDVVFQMEAFLKNTGLSSYEPPRMLLVPPSVEKLLTCSSGGRE